MIRPLTFTHYLRFLASFKGTCFLSRSLGGVFKPIFKATVGFLHQLLVPQWGIHNFPRVNARQLPERWGMGTLRINLSHNLRLDFRLLPSPVFNPSRGMSADSFSRTAASNRAYHNICKSSKKKKISQVGERAQVT